MAVVYVAQLVDYDEQGIIGICSDPETGKAWAEERERNEVAETNSIYADQPDYKPIAYAPLSWEYKAWGYWARGHRCGYYVTRYDVDNPAALNPYECEAAAT